ncbi:ABC transporter, permease protein 1 (cluster 5, nickel/peptides/opines) [hydrothermal vent metagenome]|uniref:ABC transporter, permease protein 1 (Cluster 5, nickel/peptides/opines) n=1 Tax=hydrothermal vent metagenome TaxID=652676 RepID=A0A3B0Z4X1_9ZZZZ
MQPSITSVNQFARIKRIIVWLIPRVGSALFVIWAVATIVFFLLHLVPGDPADFRFGEYTHSADRDAWRTSLGLDLPLWQQYFNFISGALRFDFGESFHSQRAVSAIILERLPATLELTVASFFVAVVIAFPLGVIAAVKKNSYVDRGAMFFSLLGQSIPNFWLGPMLIMLFSLWMGWFPVSGRTGIDSLILPAITLGTALSAILARMVRSSLLEVLGEDYIRTAKAKGLSSYTIVVKHGLRNAMLPVITLLGLQLGALLGGAVITETVFSWPGLGKLTIDSIASRDYPVTQTCILLISIFYVLVNIMTDLVYAWIDPRIRVGGLQ